MKKTVILCILDGWGYSETHEYNAIHLAQTPVWERICRECPQSLLQASGEAVGLPPGQMGNSEVGHLNLGAGRIILQSLARITQALQGDFLKTHRKLNQALQDLPPESCVHIIGLMSDGGVHSHQAHIAALGNYCIDKGVNCRIHALTDGRDCPPQSARQHLSRFAQNCRAPIVTVGGRYYAMDRDKNWQRIASAYQTICHAQTEARFQSAEAIIDAAYADNITDEFIPPAAVGDYAGIRAGDIVIIANFRADRVRQLLAMLCGDSAENIDVPPPPANLTLFGMSSYSLSLAKKMTILFPAETITQTLGEVLAEQGKTQLRLAETEKYAHVTYFFNGGREQAFAGEQRILVPSPKVKTYDLKPEMSAQSVTQHLCTAIASGDYDTVIINYANPDMVGHTGSLEAAVQAVETIDSCLGQLLNAIDARPDSEMLLTADHGNIETMFDSDTQMPHTAHTCNPVKLSYYGKRSLSLRDGILADIAPTILTLLEATKPDEMTGTCLIDF